jgi:hypothetical protein
MNLKQEPGESRLSSDESLTREEKKAQRADRMKRRTGAKTSSLCSEDALAAASQIGMRLGISDIYGQEGLRRSISGGLRIFAVLSSYYSNVLVLLT